MMQVVRIVVQSLVSNTTENDYNFVVYRLFLVSPDNIRYTFKYLKIYIFSENRSSIHSEVLRH